MTAKKSDEKQEKTQEVSDLEVRKHMVGFWIEVVCRRLVWFLYETCWNSRFDVN
jgi:hypothetical protein